MICSLCGFLLHQNVHCFNNFHIISSSSPYPIEAMGAPIVAHYSSTSLCPIFTCDVVKTLAAIKDLFKLIESQVDIFMVLPIASNGNILVFSPVIGTIVNCLFYHVQLLLLSSHSGCGLISYTYHLLRTNELIPGIIFFFMFLLLLVPAKMQVTFLLRLVFL